MERELVAIFFYQKLKEILTRYSRTISKASKNWLTSLGAELQSQNRVDSNYGKTTSPIYLIF